MHADGENIFDELKNQWGWGGFTTHDLARYRLAARLVALFNWWNIFVRLAKPDRHMEAITGRPLLLHTIATRVRHARQTTITVASSHAKSVPAAEALRVVALFLRDLIKTAEQLTGNLRQRLSGLPPGPAITPAAASCAKLMQLMVERLHPQP